MASKILAWRVNYPPWALLGLKQTMSHRLSGGWSPTNHLQQEVQRFHQVVAQIAKVLRVLFLRPLMQTGEKTTSTVCIGYCNELYSMSWSRLWVMCEECNKWAHVECAGIVQTPEKFHVRLLCCIKIGTCWACWFEQTSVTYFKCDFFVA